jgi:hypothetical protein
VDSTLTVASVTESVTVTAVAPSCSRPPPWAPAQGRQDRPAHRPDDQNIAELAPNLNDNTPNANQLQIAGAYAYDNVFLLNGVDINDNLFGSANNLFIEDALQEVQILTSGIDAQYGRFSGGVVNAVTKSGSNTFQGSFRTDINNADWIDESKTEKDAIAAATPSRTRTRPARSSRLPWADPSSRTACGSSRRPG